MGKLVGAEKAAPEALEQMKKYSERNGCRWAAYQNQALDSHNAGHLQFLAIGPTCTYQAPPDKYPDTVHGLGWRYLFVGWVHLPTGEIMQPTELPEVEVDVVIKEVNPVTRKVAPEHRAALIGGPTVRHIRGVEATDPTTSIRYLAEKYDKEKK